MSYKMTDIKALLIYMHALVEALEIEPDEDSCTGSAYLKGEFSEDTFCIIHNKLNELKQRGWENISSDSVGSIDFEAIAKPIIKYLNDKHHPHAKVIITTDTAEVVHGEVGFQTSEFIKD